MYIGFLIAHSWMRWIVLALALTAVITNWSGWLRGATWGPTQKRINTFLVISVDIQLLLGLILYAALSPSTRLAFHNFGAAMHSDQTRFWAVEHIGIMIIAIVLVHLGQALSKRAAIDVAKFKRAAIFFTIALVLFLVGIPWPFMAVHRPLFRF